MRYGKAMAIAFGPILMFAPAAQAYLGPGLGLGTFGVILGLLGSILVAILAIFWYPLKRMYLDLTGARDKVRNAAETENEQEPMQEAIDPEQQSAENR